MDILHEGKEEVAARRRTNDDDDDEEERCETRNELGNKKRERKGRKERPQGIWTALVKRSLAHRPI